MVEPELEESEAGRPAEIAGHCVSCRFYAAETDRRYPGYGECRFNAPTINAAFPDTPWPRMKGERDWCGRHESAELGFGKA